MTDTNVVTEPGTVQATTPVPEQDSARIESPDTRPPEEKGDDSTPDKKPASRKHRTEKSADNSTSDRGAFTVPTPRIVTRLQRALGLHGFYEGPADGRFEKKSVQGVQRALKSDGYEGAINGHIGEEQAKLVQTFAQKHGTYTGPINGQIDENTWVGFVVALEDLE